MNAAKPFPRHMMRLPLRTFQTSSQPRNVSSFSILRPALRSNICTTCRLRLSSTLNTPRAFFRQWPGRVRFNSSRPTPPNPSPNLGSPEPALSLSQRLKKLSREYGWTAVGVYFALSALDFPFCFVAVRMLGTDRIGRWEHNVVGAFWKVVRIPFPDLGKREPETGAGETELGAATREGGSWGTSGVEQAEADNSGIDASMLIPRESYIEPATNYYQGLWTQLALAYAIHKSFIFIRVPLTAAILPKVVKTLRGWGWDIGKRKPKLPKSS
jgi:hypothetical protein